MRDRYQAVAAVLVKVLFLNLAVAATKLVLGYATGAVSVVRGVRRKYGCQPSPAGIDASISL